jgi:peptidoglycan/xylan/chitin deacetylase (PgdA/CDA1 family)
MSSQKNDSGETPEPDEKPAVTVPESPASDERVGDESQPETPQDATELREGRTGGSKIALTFDAGASAKPTPSLLKVLADKGVHATFFLTGKWVEQNPELAKQILAEGHELGNHTYSHHDLRSLCDEAIVDELSKTEELVRTVTGASTKPYFRPPFGGRDERVLRIAAESGYKCVYWTEDSWDGFKKGIKSDEIQQRVLDRAKDGAIVLMHCGSWPTVEALPHIIDELRARGYDLVKVSELDDTSF